MQGLFFKMDKLGFVKNGVVMRLPPGFRFHPTDEELVVEYLKKKVLCIPLPASIIPEFDVCKSDPWNLPGDNKKDRYFFSPREAKYLNGNRSHRSTVSGYWKATGRDKQIVSSKLKQVVGMKKTLVFYRGKPSEGSRTDWVMHEYRLVSVEKVSFTVPQKMNQITSFAENWVVCRVSFKKQSSNTSYKPMHSHRCNSVAAVNNSKLYGDFIFKDNIGLNLGPSSSSPSSSGVTEISYHEQDEENSSCNSFAPFRRNS